MNWILSRVPYIAEYQYTDKYIIASRRENGKESRNNPLLIKYGDLHTQVLRKDLFKWFMENTWSNNH